MAQLPLRIHCSVSSPRYKTFGLAIWGSVLVLLYSSDPQIIGLALRNEETTSESYRKTMQLCLAIISPVRYWVAGIGFLLSIPLIRKGLQHSYISGKLSASRKL
jgi:hypothetical protein